MKTTIIDGFEIPELDATHVETTYRHLKTGEVFKERKDWGLRSVMKKKCRRLIFSIDNFSYIL